MVKEQICISKTDLEFIFSEHIKKWSKELIKNSYLTFQSS